MPWFYNTVSGELANESGIAALPYHGLGWHTLKIPGTDTYAQAAADAIKEFPSGAKPTGGQVQGLKQAPGQAAKDAASALSSPNPCCLVQIPYLSACILNRTQARALIGGLVFGAAGIIGIVGLSLIVLEGFQRSGAGEAAGRSLGAVGAGLAFIPGAEGAGLALGAAGSAARRAGSRSGPDQSLARRREAREAAAQAAAKAAKQQQGGTP